MSKKQMLLLVILADFAIFTGWVIWTAGLQVGFEQAFASPWSTQVSVDLGLAIGAILFWMHRDARDRGVNPWPWLVLTVLSGSLGWLTYLVARPGREAVATPSTLGAARVVA